MPKPKTDPFRITAVLALLYMVLRVFFGITQLAFNKIGGQLDLLSPAQIWLYYILPDFFAAVVIGVPLSIGLFARKRPLILGGLAASAGITLLLNLISIGMSFRFNANTAYRFFSTLSRRVGRRCFAAGLPFVQTDRIAGSAACRCVCRPCPDDRSAADHRRFDGRLFDAAHDRRHFLYCLSCQKQQ